MTLRYKVPVCYISEGDTRKTVESCLSYLTEVSEEAYRTLMAKYGDVFQQIQERLDSDLDDVVDDEERDCQEKKHYFIIKASQLTIHIRKHFVPNGEWILHPTKRGVTLSLYEWKELKKTIPLFEEREPELTIENV
jgi:hypothetical protein